MPSPAWKPSTGSPATVLVGTPKARLCRGGLRDSLAFLQNKRFIFVVEVRRRPKWWTHKAKHSAPRQGRYFQGYGCYPYGTGFFFKEVTLNVQYKDSKCPKDRINCCCRRFLSSQPDSAAVQSMFASEFHLLICQLFDALTFTQVPQPNPPVYGQLQKRVGRGVGRKYHGHHTLPPGWESDLGTSHIGRSWCCRSHFHCNTTISTFIRLQRR